METLEFQSRPKPRTGMLAHDGGLIGVGVGVGAAGTGVGVGTAGCVGRGAGAVGPAMEVGGTGGLVGLGVGDGATVGVGTSATAVDVLVGTVGSGEGVAMLDAVGDALDEPLGAWRTEMLQPPRSMAVTSQRTSRDVERLTANHSPHRLAG